MPSRKMMDLPAVWIYLFYYSPLRGGGGLFGEAAVLKTKQGREDER